MTPPEDASAQIVPIEQVNDQAAITGFIRFATEVKDVDDYQNGAIKAAAQQLLFTPWQQFCDAPPAEKNRKYILPSQIVTVLTTAAEADESGQTFLAASMAIIFYLSGPALKQESAYLNIKQPDFEIKDQLPTKELHDLLLFKSLILDDSQADESAQYNMGLIVTFAQLVDDIMDQHSAYRNTEELAPLVLKEVGSRDLEYVEKVSVRLQEFAECSVGPSFKRFQPLAYAVIKKTLQNGFGY